MCSFEILVLTKVFHRVMIFMFEILHKFSSLPSFKISLQGTKFFGALNSQNFPEGADPPIALYF